METLRRIVHNQKTAGALAMLAMVGGFSSEFSIAEALSKQKSAKIHHAAPKIYNGITIEGDNDCKNQTTAALRLLNNKAHKHFEVVSKYIKIIECVPKGSGIYANEAKPRFVVGDAERHAGVDWFAGTIVCDANHSREYHKYQQKHPKKSVPDIAWKGRESEAVCLNAEADALKDIGAPSYEIQYVENVINTGYWNLPYPDRYW